MNHYRRQDYFADRRMDRHGAPLHTEFNEQLELTKLKAFVLGVCIAVCLFYGTACAVAIIAGSF